MQTFPSAGGRTVWVKDTAANDIDAVTTHALASVRRSRTVRLTKTHIKNGGRTRWYEFELQKVRVACTAGML